MEHNTPKKGEDPVSFLWDSPARLHPSSNRYTTRLLFLFGVLFSLLFLFFKDPVLIMGVWAVVFAVFMWLKTPPLIVKNKITNFGVYWYGNIIPFSSIYGFSVHQKNNGEIIRIYLSHTAHSYLSLVLPSEKAVKMQIITYLREQLPYIDDPPVSGLEHFSSGLARLFGFAQ